MLRIDKLKEMKIHILQWSWMHNSTDANRKLPECARLGARGRTFKDTSKITPDFEKPTLKYFTVVTTTKHLGTFWKPCIIKLCKLMYRITSISYLPLKPMKSSWGKPDGFILATVLLSKTPSRCGKWKSQFGSWQTSLKLCTGATALPIYIYIYFVVFFHMQS